MGDNKIEIDFTLLAIIIAMVCFIGEPDLIDAIIFKLTGIQNW